MTHTVIFAVIPADWFLVKGDIFLQDHRHWPCFLSRIQEGIERLPWHFHRSRHWEWNDTALRVNKEKMWNEAHQNKGTCSELTPLTRISHVGFQLKGDMIWKEIFLFFLHIAVGLEDLFFCLFFGQTAQNIPASLQLHWVVFCWGIDAGWRNGEQRVKGNRRIFLLTAVDVMSKVLHKGQTNRYCHCQGAVEAQATARRVGRTFFRFCF